jgi:hypothetical protein
MVAAVLAAAAAQGAAGLAAALVRQLATLAHNSRLVVEVGGR